MSQSAICTVLHRVAPVEYVCPSVICPAEKSALAAHGLILLDEPFRWFRGTLRERFHDAKRSGSPPVERGIVNGRWNER